MKELISQSKEMSQEYCASVVRLGEVKPIENSDFLGVTVVEGCDIVVRKDSVHENDVMIYVCNECQIDSEFLRVNNEFSETELNANFADVTRTCQSMQAAGASEEEIATYVTQSKGYFGKNGRVRMKRLRGVASMGYLIKPESMVVYEPELNGFDWESHVGENFDTVGGRLFVQPYMPPVSGNSGGGGNKRDKKLRKYDRMIPGQFAFHYDTKPLGKNMDRLKPEANVTISVKEHGTSAIFSNIKVKKPKWGGLYEKVFVYLPKFLQFTVEDYDVVYSSRSVIKNQSINPAPDRPGGFYGADVWGEYYNILKNYIPKGVSIYGEIVGYLTGSSSMIQKDYDYGCPVGTNKLMIYRIHYADPEIGELNVGQVKEYTDALIREIAEENPEAASRIKPINILYSGALKDLYPDLDPANHWQENLLEKLKNDKNFGMEKNEPMCKNKVPREGIVLRIDDDPLNEAFKLKCLKFLSKEAETMDAGDVSDMEMQERYGKEEA